MWNATEEELEKAAENIDFKPGNGRRINFFIYVWCGNAPPAKRYAGL